jgi:hypothetical protein
MSNPYYIGGMANYNPNFLGQPQNTFAQPYVNPVQATNNYSGNNYDFVGKYVKSYDEVKNAPFEDKTCIYLDTEHDRVYIKEVTSEGVPKVNVLGLMDIQNIPATPEKDAEPTEPSMSKSEIEDLVKHHTTEVTERIEKRLKTLEDKVQKNF